MSKAVLVMDMPEKCKECSLHCYTFGCRVWMKRHDDFNNSKPDWCPLSEFPKKIGTEEALKIPRNGCISDVINSYNACIDELLKVEE